ncbi:hypothetical protein PI125_g20786 [Phytophthora idaei]|nr:hypothetical protein PI125_g20786 [Phytophthora idaei]
MAIASPKMSYRELAQWAKMTFKLHSTPNKSMVSRTLKARSRLLEDAADHADRKKAPTHGQLLLDHNVVDFIMLAELQGIALSGDLIVYHAKKLGRKLGIQRAQQPRFGRSWLRCLQERYGFRWRHAFSEASSVDLDGIQEELDALKAVIRQYSPSNVFNMDESAFFYNAAPRGSICKNTAPALKQNKARVTMACCANVDGTEKLPLLFLGTAAKPRWYAKKPADMRYAGTERSG